MLFIAPKEEMYTQLTIPKVYTNISYTITFHTFYGTYGRNVFPNYTQAIQKLFMLFIAPMDEMYSPIIPKVSNIVFNTFHIT